VAKSAAAAKCATCCTNAALLPYLGNNVPSLTRAASIIAAAVVVAGYRTAENGTSEPELFLPIALLERVDISCFRQEFTTRDAKIAKFLFFFLLFFARFAAQF